MLECTICTCAFPIIVGNSLEFQNSALHLKAPMHLLSFYNLPVTQQSTNLSSTMCSTKHLITEKGPLYPTEVIGGRREPLDDGVYTEKWQWLSCFWKKNSQLPASRFTQLSQTENPFSDALYIISAGNMRQTQHPTAKESTWLVRHDIARCIIMECFTHNQEESSNQGWSQCTRTRWQIIQQNHNLAKPQYIQVTV